MNGVGIIHDYDFLYRMSSFYGNLPDIMMGDFTVLEF